jgi:crossover junction endodeoxyribonuclease RusA
VGRGEATGEGKGEVIYLRFPPKALSPNARLHWRAVARTKKIYRHECFIEAKRQGVLKMASSEKVKVSLVFYPPDKRKRDWDNMLAACKSGLDGLADAMGVDDRNWELSFTVASEIKNMVSVEIKTA